MHERQYLVLLARDHARLTFGRPHHQNVPNVPGEIVVEVVQLVDRELVAEHVGVRNLFKYFALCPLALDLVTQDAVGNGVHTFKIPAVHQILKAQTVVGRIVPLGVAGHLLHADYPF